MTTWFTSDTHYYHANVIQYSSRPFSSVLEMNEGMISRYNSVVAVDDTVYHLGDFGFGKVAGLQGVLDRLNGEKHLILGNHDKQARRLTGWSSIQHYLEITLDGVFIVLFHYGLRVWNRSHYGSLALYGHSHGGLAGNSQSLDVGVDCWDYYPVNLAAIRTRMATLPSYK